VIGLGLYHLSEIGVDILDDARWRFDVNEQVDYGPTRGKKEISGTFVFEIMSQANQDVPIVSSMPCPRKR